MKLNNYDDFLYERRISQISTNIEVTYAFDIVKTKHAEDRSDLTNRNLGFNAKLSNKDISDFIDKFKTEIAEGIANGDIEDETNFIIKNKDLALAIIAEQESNMYWKLVIKTIFPQDRNNSLRIGKDQLVYTK